MTECEFIVLWRCIIAFIALFLFGYLCYQFGRSKAEIFDLDEDPNEYDEDLDKYDEDEIDPKIREKIYNEGYNDGVQDGICKGYGAGYKSGNYDGKMTGW